MPHFTNESLVSQGYGWFLTKTFEAHSGNPLARNSLFKEKGVQNITPPEWLRDAVRLARGMGFLDMPVIEKDEGHKLSYSFYFKSLPDYANYELALNGIVYRKRGFTALYRLGDNPIEKMDTCLDILHAFCLHHDIDCEFRQQDEKTIELVFDSNADRNAFFHAAKRENGLEDKINEIWASQLTSAAAKPGLKMLKWK